MGGQCDATVGAPQQCVRLGGKGVSYDGRYHANRSACLVPFQHTAQKRQEGIDPR